MNDAFTISIPANTLERAPISADFFTNLPFLRGGMINFQDGCSLLVGIKIMERGDQIFPRTYGRWAIDNKPVSFTANRRLISPYQLTIVGCNLDHILRHIIHINFDLDLRG